MDDREFAERAKACERKLFRVARTILACDADCEDALQEAILKAWAARKKVRQAAFFDTWLIRILINECRNIQRRDFRKPDAGPAPDLPPQHPELYEALMALPEKYRLPVMLHYIEGYEMKEIGEMLAVPAGTVKWRLHQTRKLLKDQLMEVAT